LNANKKRREAGGGTASAMANTAEFCAITGANERTALFYLMQTGNDASHAVNTYFDANAQPPPESWNPGGGSASSADGAPAAKRAKKGAELMEPLQAWRTDINAATMAAQQLAQLVSMSDRNTLYGEVRDAEFVAACTAILFCERRPGDPSSATKPARSDAAARRRSASSTSAGASSKRKESSAKGRGRSSSTRARGPAWGLLESRCTAYTEDVALTADPFWVGRSHASECVLSTNQHISKRHCVFTRGPAPDGDGDDGTAAGGSTTFSYLEDVSSNGTCLNRTRMVKGERTLLHDGDLVHIIMDGVPDTDIAFEFHTVSDDAEVAAERAGAVLDAEGGFSLCTVTFHANLAHSLTRSPKHL
jgi:hypothetical protein